VHSEHHDHENNHHSDKCVVSSQADRSNAFQERVPKLDSSGRVLPLDTARHWHARDRVPSSNGCIHCAAVQTCKTPALQLRALFHF